ncbi:MAG: substrate-binding domain-containing protein [Firmicutes bacterium]|nr:substrate-binding domain-containing protein [Bacillota bacterium]MBQ6685274.1 substrate-binding domain-containing protein [Bacillota bacterium]
MMKRLFEKRLLAVIMIIALLAGMMMTGCGKDETGGDNSVVDPGQESGHQRGEIDDEVRISPAKDLQMTPEEYPIVDGSTATIPLSEAFAASVMQIDVEEARQYVLHNTTHDAYVNLIEGKADIIFVTMPSDDELALAKEAGVELVVTPIVNEGFVFLTSTENPQTNLSYEQVQGIYRGEITNWNQVGGPDMEIIAYQRPVNSGSQTGMLEMVVPADEIMDAPTEMRMQGMGDLVEAVADYENSPGAIGYSYFYYVTDMWINEGVKLLSIDGEMPSVKSIEEETYPILTHYYAVTRGNMAEDSNTIKLLEWILSSEGQKIAEQAGYVKVGNVK